MMKVLFIAAFSSFVVTSTSAHAVVIDFDDLTEAEEVSDQFAEALFGSEPGFFVRVTNGRNFGNSPPFFICSTPVGNSTQSCREDISVDFSLPVNDLTFLALGDTPGVIASVDVFEDGAFAGTADIVGDGDQYDPVLVDLTSFRRVTGILIYDVTAGGGLGYDDFSFTPVPEPSSFGLAALGLLGLAMRKPRAAQRTGRSASEGRANRCGCQKAIKRS